MKSEVPYPNQKVLGNGVGVVGDARLLDGRHVWLLDVVDRRPAEIIITHPGNLATDW